MNINILLQHVPVLSIVNIEHKKVIAMDKWNVRFNMQHKNSTVKYIQCSQKSE